jgi:hypothetical protein
MPWDPSDKHLIIMRRMSRSGASLREIHDAIKPPIQIENFREALRRFGITPVAGARAHAGTSGLKVSPGGRK